MSLLNTNETTNETKYDYKDIIVKHVRTKEKKILFDLSVNGITIYNMVYREYKNNEGEEGVIIAFPSFKGDNNKYFNHVWFPISKELKNTIITEITNAVNNSNK